MDNSKCSSKIVRTSHYQIISEFEWWTNSGENSSFILTVCAKSVPRYHFKLACVVLQRIFRSPLLIMEK